MSSFFKVGERYRDRYVIESVEAFLDGELAIARTDENDWYYLQLSKLKRGTQSRVIQQYRSLDHPLVLPYVEVYTEERSIVFIRPYIALTRLDERLRMQPWDEEETVRLTRELLLLEKMLNSRPLPMYLMLDPRNIRLTEEGNLKVFFCGVKNYTALEPVINWGTWMYMCMTGQIFEEPLTKLPSDRPFSGPMGRLIERSLKKASVDQVLSQMEAYEKRKNSPGLLSRLFGGDNRRSREEKREESLNLPPKKFARTDSSAEGKVKPPLGERIKPKVPFGSPEGSPVVPEVRQGVPPSEGHGFSTESREPFVPEKRPDMQRMAEEPKVSPAVEAADQLEKSDSVETVSPAKESLERENLSLQVEEDPGAEASIPSVKIDQASLSQDFTAATKDEAPRTPDVQEPELEDAPRDENPREEKEKGEFLIPEQPSTEEEKPAWTAPQPSIADVSPALDRASQPSAPVEEQRRKKQEREEMDRLMRERLIRERREHDRLASQFRECAKMFQIGEGNP